MTDFKELAEILENAEEPDERLEAVNSLGILDVPGAARVLVQALRREKDPVVKEAMTNALLMLPAEEVIEEVAVLLSSEEASLRSIAFDVLICKSDEYSARVFETLLQDSDRDTRVMTVHVLGRSKNPLALELLRKTVRLDSDVNVVGAALEYLGEAGDLSDARLVEQCRVRFNHPYIDYIIERVLTRLRGYPEMLAKT
ncbi:MAG: HEAT repeat domain-containing protein [Firmicutes bacterium]|nr:HEAT repeat domain-containing protein [Bacillota bacterium]